ncbi:MAG: ComEC/Rec2 family competence protein [Verrucomicrobiales bacterium]
MKFLLPTLSLAASLLAAAPAEAADGKLKIYWPDVEGGAATLIVTPAGESILVDTGMPGERDPKRIFKVATEKAGLKKIDHLITTHFHMDHFGGAAELAKLMPIGTVYDNGIPSKNPDNPNDQSDRFAKQIQPYQEMKVEKRVQITPGMEIPLNQANGSVNLKLTCLGTEQEFIAKPDANIRDNLLCQTAREKPADTSDNANSAVFLLKFGNFEFFNAGDLTWNVEQKLVCPVNLVGPVDVFQAVHHGLDQSNNPLLVKSLAPTVSIMSNGTTKGCGAETFATLKGTATIQAMYQIHKNLRKDSENNTQPEYIANLEKDCEANHIELTVEPTAKTYTVAIPAKEHSRTFQTR